jgi:hypothetical protein
VSRPHTFTEPLARLIAAHGDCVEYECLVAAHEGLQAPEGYLFRRARSRVRWSGWAGPELPSGVPPGAAGSRYGRLAADWVEVFAPVVFAPPAPQRWPEDGTLGLDHFYFRLCTVATTAARHHFGWHISALAYQGERRARAP